MKIRSYLILIAMACIVTGCATPPSSTRTTTVHGADGKVVISTPPVPPLPPVESPKLSLWQRFKIKIFGAKKPKSTVSVKMPEKEMKEGKLYIDHALENSMRVFWIASPTERYTLYSSTNPVGDETKWQKVLEMTGEGKVFSYIDNTDSPSKFYKLKAKKLTSE